MVFNKIKYDAKLVFLEAQIPNASASQVEGDAFDPWGRRQNLLHKIRTVPTQYVFKNHTYNKLEPLFVSTGKKYLYKIVIVLRLALFWKRN